MPSEDKQIKTSEFGPEKFSCWTMQGQVIQTPPNPILPEGFQQSIFFFFLLRAAPLVCEVPRLGVKSELQLPDYAIATATLDWGSMCHLYHSLWQCQNAGTLIHWERPGIILVSSWILVAFLTHWATRGTPRKAFLKTRWGKGIAGYVISSD